MAGVIQITCAKCDRSMKVPAEGVGKKIRCKGCGHAFIIEDPAARKKKPPAQKAAKPAKAKKPARAAVDDDEDANPYGITDEDLTPRCPECANEMESEDAVICLHCGYNTQTRTHVSTKRVYEPTGGEKFLWLLPGILCVVGIFVLIGYDVFHHFALPGICFDEWDKLIDEGKSRSEAIGEVDWWAFIFHPGFELWIFIISAFGCYSLGKFAVKRLVYNNKPPERVKEDRKKK